MNISFKENEECKNNCHDMQNLELDNPDTYKIQETDCADVASVDTCLNVRTPMSDDELLSSMNLNYFIRH